MICHGKARLSVRSEVRSTEPYAAGDREAPAEKQDRWSPSLTPAPKVGGLGPMQSSCAFLVP